MDLFSQEDSPQRNRLPYDGTVHFYGFLLPEQQATHYFNQLLRSIEWKNDEAIIFGKHIRTQRKVAWYGDTDFHYSYSGIQKTALPWNETLLELKDIVEKISNETFNSCLLNLYHNGSEGMAWHSDSERDLKKDGAIASLTFGAERKFSFKHKINKVKVDIRLENGSLLLMKDVTQTYWLHRLPPTKQRFGPRINLTFRTITKQKGT